MSMGYRHAVERDDDIDGHLMKHYFKRVPTGRMHVCTESVNALATRVVIHFDKFKGNREKKFHHVSFYDHPYVRREENLFIKKLGM